MQIKTKVVEPTEEGQAPTTTIEVQTPDGQVLQSAELTPGKECCITVTSATSTDDLDWGEGVVDTASTEESEEAEESSEKSDCPPDEDEPDPA